MTSDSFEAKSTFCQMAEMLGYKIALAPEDEACDYTIVDEWRVIST